MLAGVASLIGFSRGSNRGMTLFDSWDVMSECMPRIVSFPISKDAIRVSLAELPALISPEVHESLAPAVNAVSDPVHVTLAERFAIDFLHWLKAAAYRHKRDAKPSARAMAEAARALESAIYHAGK